MTRRSFFLALASLAAAPFVPKPCKEWSGRDVPEERVYAVFAARGIEIRTG